MLYLPLLRVILPSIRPISPLIYPNVIINPPTDAIRPTNAIVNYITNHSIRPSRGIVLRHGRGRPRQNI